METDPMEGTLLEVLFFHAQVRFFLSKFGVDSLKDSKDHEHVGVIGSLFMK